MQTPPRNDDKEGQQQLEEEEEEEEEGGQDFVTKGGRPLTLLPAEHFEGASVSGRAPVPLLPGESAATEE